MKKILKKCGGCGNKKRFSLSKVRDKMNNLGYLCSPCKKEYHHLLQQESSKRFWMCGECRFRILAGTRIDAQVDPESKCPNCGSDVNLTLVNLKENQPVGSDALGHPID